MTYGRSLPEHRTTSNEAKVFPAGGLQGRPGVYKALTHRKNIEGIYRRGDDALHVGLAEAVTVHLHLV